MALETFSSGELCALILKLIFDNNVSNISDLKKIMNDYGDYKHVKKLESLQYFNVLKNEHIIPLPRLTEFFSRQNNRLFDTYQRFEQATSVLLSNTQDFISDKVKWQDMIKKYCIDRDIKYLCHFTRLENLGSILLNGVIPRSVLEKGDSQFIINDEERYDRFRDACCFSISFPNYKLFYTFRNKYPETNWVVLFYDVSLLWEYKSYCCITNAAFKCGELNFQLKISPDRFQELFADFYVGGKNVKRNDLGIPESYPTNPQAEVLIFDTVPVKEIKYVYFMKQVIFDNWLKNAKILVHGNYEAIKHIDFRVLETYFHPRKDYLYWQ